MARISQNFRVRIIGEALRLSLVDLDLLLMCIMLARQPYIPNLSHALASILFLLLNAYTLLILAFEWSVIRTKSATQSKVPSRCWFPTGNSTVHSALKH